MRGQRERDPFSAGRRVSQSGAPITQEASRGREDPSGRDSGLTLPRTGEDLVGRPTHFLADVSCAGRSRVPCFFDRGELMENHKEVGEDRSKRLVTSSHCLSSV